MRTLIWGHLPFFLAVLIFLSTGTAGCDKKADRQNVSEGTAVPAPGNTAVREPSLPATAPASGPSGSNTLAIAQKEYLAAYEQYVKSLRESGPQTIETLQALADYQKKYQMYQMLLGAEKGK